LNQKKILEVNIMKAVVLDGFGDSEVMHIGEAQTPVPDNGRVTIPRRRANRKYSGWKLPV
jgi:NADPH:quinone reductase-like Zn-dependent oxidoreductase